MSSLPLHKIFSPRWIEETARELNSRQQESNTAEELADAVADEMAKEMWIALYPDDTIPANHFQMMHSAKGRGLGELIEAMVAECLNAEKLSQET